MEKTVSKSDFRDAFRTYERQDNFSYEGLGALFDYIEELDESCDTETELDVIAICCEYTEHETAHKAASEYFDYEGMHFDEEGNETETVEEVEQKALEYLQDRTQVITFDSGIIIQDF